MTDANRSSYHSPRREQAAAATRRAIIDAAQELFLTQGYVRTTVGQIARAAQVAPNTVYTSVGGKADLLRAIQDAGTGDPAGAETLDAVARSTDPAEIVRLTANGTRRASERQDERITVLLQSAQADPHAAEILQAGLRGYRETLDKSVQRLVKLGVLRPSEQSRASDVFWYLFGMTSWQTLVKDLGWTFDEAERWLAQRGIEILLEPPPATTRARRPASGTVPVRRSPTRSRRSG